MVYKKKVNSQHNLTDHFFQLSVLSVDVLDRYVDENGVLRTTRLVLKKGKVPKWFPQNVNVDRTSRNLTINLFILVAQEF